MTKIKALLLIPVAFTGMMTALASSIPPRTMFDLLLPLAVLAPFYLAILWLLAAMWRHPPGRRYLGHSRGTWSFLAGVAYLAGLSCWFVP